MPVRLLHRYWPLTALLSLAIEANLIIAAFVLAFSPSFLGSNSNSLALILGAGAVFAFVLVFSFYLFGLYDFRLHMDSRKRAMQAVGSILFGSTVLWVVYLGFPEISIELEVFAAAVSLSAVFAVSWRMLLSWICNNGFVSTRVMILGTDEIATMIGHEISARRHQGYKVIGFLKDPSEMKNTSSESVGILGTYNQIYPLARANNVDHIVVALRENRGRLDLDGLLKCKTAGIKVQHATDFIERLTGKIDVKSLRKSALIFTDGFMVSRVVLFQKRLLDILVAVVGILLTAPLMALTAIAIRLDSQGPIFFKQERVGLGGVTFTLWKFRSMYQGAETSTGPQWAERVDTRVTRVGKFIRKNRIDELPQLWNVLKADMSVVGPRPEREVFTQKLLELCPFYEQRFVIRPGLTGWAQINAPYAASYEDSISKLEYDLFYIKNLSFTLDLSILISTLKVVLWGQGGR